MSIKNNYILFLLVIVLLCCTSAVSAVSNNTIDNVMSEVDSGDEFISVSADDQVDNLDETVLSAQEEYDNLTVNNDDEVLSQDSNYESLGVTSSETNNYLNGYDYHDITSFYKKNCTICMHIFTEFNEFSVSKIDVVDAFYHNGFFDVRAKVLDSNNNLVKDFELICSPDISGGVKEYQFLKTNDNGEVTLTFSNGIKIINNQLSVSFAFYDALASPIIRKTVNINCPSIIEGNIESISTSTHAKIGSINVKGNVGSISTGTQGKITSINVDGRSGSISTGTQGKIGSINVKKCAGTIKAGRQGKIQSCTVG